MRWCAMALAVLAACEGPHGPRNRAPTVVITAGPDQSVPGDTARFSWQGSDADGSVVGYEYALDDTTPYFATESMTVLLSGIPAGRHVFYVRSVDDSGATSAAATRSFRSGPVVGIVPRGTDSTFEVVTWNVENFPLEGDSTVKLVRMLVQALDVDLFALQEIADTVAFRTLLAGLPGFSGLYSQDDYGNSYQKTGVIYRTSVCTVTGVEQLFWGNDSFPRPPLLMAVRAALHDAEFDFRLIVLHMKAGFSWSDQSKRAVACRRLKEYIDAAVGQGGDGDFIVAGDWNDELDDSSGSNVFLPLLQDTAAYRFLTLPLAGNSWFGSYISTGNLIDHVMVTGDALAEYAGGYTVTLRLDDELEGYDGLVSDHRPVLAVFPVFRQTMPEGGFEPSSPSLGGGF